jgi:GT2 family glycosyltransferase
MLAPQILKANGQRDVNYRWPNTHWKAKAGAAEGLLCVGFVCGAVMLLRMDQFQTMGFFDEDFFLYYEDEDLSQRAFNAKLSMVVVPQIKLKHLSRGSVKGSAPLRSEFFRGFHHAQSKILLEKKHGKQANWLRWKTLGLALLSLPFRLLVPQPKYIARLLGRTVGLMRGS